MNWDKVSTEQRMRHPDETLHDGFVKPDRGVVRAKRTKSKNVEDRREHPAGAEALLAKMSKKSTPVKTQSGHKATTSRSAKVTATKATAKVRTSGSRSATAMAGPSRSSSRMPSRAPDPGEAAAVIGAFLKVLCREEISAPEGVVDRLEGAYLALKVLSEGRCPSPAEVLGERHGD